MRKILVLLTGKAIDAEAMSLACQLGKARAAQVCPVAVVQVGRTLPLDAAGLPEMAAAEQWLAQAGQQATASGCAAKPTLLTTRAAGPAVVDEVVERSVDVLVMGLAYGKRFGECDLGETAEYVLRHTPCQVWLVREAAVALEGDRADESR